MRFEPEDEGRATQAGVFLHGLEWFSAAMFAIGTVALIVLAVYACLETSAVLGVVACVAALGLGCGAAYAWS